MKDKNFWDTNLWIYLLAESENPTDQNKKEVVKKRLQKDEEVHISVQVLNEVANVLLKKYGLSVTEAQEYLEQISQVSEVPNLSQEAVFQALNLKNKYGFSWYDSLIVSSARQADCQKLLSEDLQNGLLIMRIRSTKIAKKLFRNAVGVLSL